MYLLKVGGNQQSHWFLPSSINGDPEAFEAKNQHSIATHFLITSRCRWLRYRNRQNA